MKNLSLILNVVLIIAVSVLYYLHFSSQNPASANSKATPAMASKEAKTIVYVNSDSLLAKYDFYKSAQKEMEEKRGKLETELGGRARALQNEIVAFQQKGPSMSQEQAQTTERQLMQKQQALQQYQEQVSRQQGEEERKRIAELYEKIEKYIEKYNEAAKYNFVLGYTKGGGILYANDNLDITKEILDGLNKEYNAEKPATK